MAHDDSNLREEGDSNPGWQERGEWPEGAWVGLSWPEDDHVVERLKNLHVSRETWNGSPKSVRDRARRYVNLMAEMGYAVPDLFATDATVAARADDYLGAFAKAEPSVVRRNGYGWYREGQQVARIARRLVKEIAPIIKVAKEEAKLARQRLNREEWASRICAEVNARLETSLGQFIESWCTAKDLEPLTAWEMPSRVAARIVAKAAGVSADQLRRSGGEGARP